MIVDLFSLEYLVKQQKFVQDVSLVFVSIQNQRRLSSHIINTSPLMITRIQRFVKSSATFQMYNKINPLRPSSSDLDHSNWGKSQCSARSSP